MRRSSSYPSRDRCLANGTSGGGQHVVGGAALIAIGILVRNGLARKQFRRATPINFFDESPLACRITPFQRKAHLCSGNSPTIVMAAPPRMKKEFDFDQTWDGSLREDLVQHLDPALRDRPRIAARV